MPCGQKINKSVKSDLSLPLFFFLSLSLSPTLWLAGSVIDSG